MCRPNPSFAAGHILLAASVVVLQAFQMIGHNAPRVRVMVLGLALAYGALCAGPASAEVDLPTFNFGGYFRIMARPDLQGGDGTLGYSNLYGRLLNERPYAALELRLNLLKPVPDHSRPWTSLHFKVEGGALQNVTPSQGRFADMRLSQAYVLVGDLWPVFMPDVTFQLGTLDSYFGDLGLYDRRPAQIFFETAGASARYRKRFFDGLLGVDGLFGFGDSGYFLRGFSYSPIPTVGGSLRLSFSRYFEVGGGGQFLYEPRVDGNPNAPHTTPGIDYEEFLRGEIVENFLENNPGRIQDFPNPQAQALFSGKAIGYIGFGNLGPLLWSNLFMSATRVHAQQKTAEAYAGGMQDIYIAALTDDRYEIVVGDETQFTIWPKLIDVTIALLYQETFDFDNVLAPSDFDMRNLSSVGRGQLYITDAIHLLAETSFAYEYSKQGNRFRLRQDSIFKSAEGTSDVRGLEFGDANTRYTWQGKGGVVINPLGRGIYLRPSLRFLYGVQYSNQNRAYGNNFIDSLDQFNVFGGQEVHWHHIIAVEAEAWF